MSNLFQRRLPSIESLSTALAVAHFGSFSAAAIELSITHAAVSRRIASLENWAGIQIFKRHTRGVVVTESGQRVLARLDNAMSQIENLSISKKTKHLPPPIRLAVTPSFARFFLLPRISQLSGTPNDLHIELFASLNHADLLGGEVDLAIRYGCGAWSKTHAVRLIEDNLVPVISKTIYPRKLSNLLDLPLLHDGDSSNWRTWCIANGLSYRQKSSDRTLCDYALALEAARAGLGVALWNQDLHGLDQFGHDLVPLDSPPTKGHLAYYLLARSGNNPAPIEKLRQRLIDCI